MRRGLLLLFLLALAAAGAGGAYAWWRLPVAVTTVPVETGTAAEIVYASGTVEPADWAKVTSLVSRRIVEVCGCEGEEVPAGHLLVRLDDSEAMARLQELQAQRALAERELARSERLLERNVGSEQTFDRANADLARVDASIAAVRVQLADHLIAAPVAGQVLRLDASVGEIAVPGAALAYVGRPRPVDVVAEVNEEDIPRVAPGQTVLIRAEAFRDRALAGTVGRITPMGDPVQKTYRVRIRLPDDTPLFIGMTVDANIVIRESAGHPVIPVAALSGDTVFVVEDGRLAARPVTIGIRGIDKVEVTAGLAAGERIVQPVPEGARPGLRVREAGAAP
jgi:membrane fusion protein (multidrug efflux system)